MTNKEPHPSQSWQYKASFAIAKMKESISTNHYDVLKIMNVFAEYEAKAKIPSAPSGSAGQEPVNNISGISTPCEALRDAAGLAESEANRWSHDEKTSDHWRAVAVQLRAQLLICEVRGGFKCQADKSGIGGNTPQECNWPMCGCDPYADKVINTVMESGITLVLPRRAGLEPEGRAESAAEKK